MQMASCGMTAVSGWDDVREAGWGTLQETQLEQVAW